MILGRFNMKGYNIEVVDEQARNDIEEVRESIPQYTSQLTNDSGFITSTDIPPIPTKTSELENDSGFTTFDGNYNSLTNKPTIPSRTSQLLNDSGFTTFSGNYNDLTNKPTIPTKTSQLTNDSNFTTQTEVNKKLTQDKPSGTSPATSLEVGYKNGLFVIALHFSDNTIAQLAFNNTNIAYDYYNGSAWSHLWSK